MKAKLIKVIEPEKGQPWYLRQYEYKCIKCGDLYYRSGYGKHINPYCGKCSYEIEKIRRREQARTKRIKDINKVLNDIKTEIETEKESMIQHNGTSDLGIAIEIIDKYIRKE